MGSGNGSAPINREEMEALAWADREMMRLTRGKVSLVEEAQGKNSIKLMKTKMKISVIDWHSCGKDWRRGWSLKGENCQGKKLTWDCRGN